MELVKLFFLWVFLSSFVSAMVVSDGVLHPQSPRVGEQPHGLDLRQVFLFLLVFDGQGCDFFFSLYRCLRLLFVCSLLMLLCSKEEW